MVRRDNFKLSVKNLLADRACHHCSSPFCCKPTTGPNTDPNKRLSIGVAAHISAAAPGGPRYDENMTLEQRTSIDNGIWLCQSCATAIDKDEEAFSALLLHEWKANHEQLVRDKILSNGINSLLKTNGILAPGLLSVDTLYVKFENGYCLLDFRVTNRGGSDVMINAVKLIVSECIIKMRLGHAEFSQIYDADMSDATLFGSQVVVETSQLLNPGESDRFGIKISGSKLGPCDYGWRTKLILVTNWGSVDGGEIDFWLPKKSNFVCEIEKDGMDPFAVIKLGIRRNLVSYMEQLKPYLEYIDLKEEQGFETIHRMPLENGGIQLGICYDTNLIWYSCKEDFLDGIHDILSDFKESLLPFPKSQQSNFHSLSYYEVRSKEKFPTKP